LLDQTTRVYKTALNAGIAKEVARKVLPEGLTMSKMYMKGTLRNWLHYIDVRTDMATQKEHRIIAEQCKEIVFKEYPAISEMYQKE
jgi:thymidylate synthase (FAD)